MTHHIHIRGQVQGVGFRPFVYTLATELDIPGTVSNGRDGVHVYFNASADQAGNFYQQLLRKAPVRSRILAHELTTAKPTSFSDFSIIPSLQTGPVRLVLTPDLGLCPDCRREIRNAADRRYQYAFNSCIHCGPRYSIVHRLPYDREQTTMDKFHMCEFCSTEYNDPRTRRHYSQTNSCPDCGITLQLRERNQENWREYEGKQADLLRRTTELIRSGRIVAIKGIGGYLLVCDATNADSIRTLRQRKHRPDKPFALMYPDVESLHGDARISAAEEAAFGSIESSIVLVSFREKPASEIAVSDIAPELDQIGVMQPYTPLFELLLRDLGKPVVATSGNLSGSPIYYRDGEARESLGDLVDAILANNREILLPQDDSVLRFAPQSDRRILLRRSRGLAPTFAGPVLPGWEDRTILAMGADLKSAFALQYGGQTYTSQYLGRLDNYDSQRQFEHTLDHLLDLFDARPERILADKHPAYFSAKIGEKHALNWQIPFQEVQHHEAHFAAVLGENDLLRSPEPVLGVIWDGTGWDENADGQPRIRGGEFYRFTNLRIQHLDSLEPFPQILGDKMAREPRLSALAVAGGLPRAQQILRPLFRPAEWNLYRRLLSSSSPSHIQTSSIGRLFDAVAALLGLCPVSTFEGQAAMQLEALARSCPPEAMDRSILTPMNRTLLIKTIVEGVLAEEPKEVLAWRFHYLLVHWVAQVARREQIDRLAFSGGVFQNALLTDLLAQELGAEFQLFFHRELSPNDECIGFGQLCHYWLQEHAASSVSPKKETICV